MSKIKQVIPVSDWAFVVKDKRDGTTWHQPILALALAVDVDGNDIVCPVTVGDDGLIEVETNFPFEYGNIDVIAVTYKGSTMSGLPFP
jgi:hypothetical protein